MDRRKRELELVETLKQYRGQEPLKSVIELLTMRYEHIKESLVEDESLTTRGRAQEVRDLLRKFC